MCSLSSGFTRNTLLTCCLINVVGFIFSLHKSKQTNKKPYVFHFTTSLNLSRGFPFPCLHSLIPRQQSWCSFREGSDLNWTQPGWRCYSQNLSECNDCPHLPVTINAADWGHFLSLLKAEINPTPHKELRFPAALLCRTRSAPNSGPFCPRTHSQPGCLPIFLTLSSRPCSPITQNTLRPILLPFNRPRSVHPVPAAPPHSTPASSSGIPPAPEAGRAAQRGRWGAGASSPFPSFSHDPRPPPNPVSGIRRAPVPEAPGELRAALGAGSAGRLGEEAGGGGGCGAEPVGAQPALAAAPQLRPRSSSPSALRGPAAGGGAGPGRIVEGVDSPSPQRAPAAAQFRWGSPGSHCAFYTGTGLRGRSPARAWARGGRGGGGALRSSSGLGWRDL